MVSETFERIVTRILQDAPSQKISLDDPENEFTIWADFGNVMKHCGSRRSLDSIQMLAARHINLQDLYILRAPFDNFGIMRFERG